MPKWFLPYAVLVALMLAAFIAIGMASLWAATSERHRLIRSAAVLLLPAPLLLRQAYDLYSVFLIEIVIVICGTLAYGIAADRRESAEPESEVTRRARVPVRFSLSTLLIMMAAIAVILAATIQLPKWQDLAWRTVVISGVGAAVGTLAGAWLYVNKRRWTAWPIVFVVCIAIGTGISKLDWFFESALQMAGWPPQPFTPENFMGDPTNYDHYDIWSFIPLTIAVATMMLIGLWRATAFASDEQPAHDRRSSTGRGIARIAFVACALVVGALPLFVMAALVLPASVPQPVLPSPNAHDDFQRAGQLAKGIKLNVFDIETAKLDALSPFASEVKKVDSVVQEGLTKTCCVPMDYFVAQSGLSNAQTDNYMAVEWALVAKARLAAAAGRFDDAADVYLRALDFGFSACRGTMINESTLVRSRGVYGVRGIYSIYDNLNDQKLRDCIKRLVAIDSSDEPMQAVLDRYRVWAERRNGWHGHLKYLLEVYTLEPGNSLSSDFWEREWFTGFYRRSHAVTRLLICELAILQFKHEHKRRPKTLDELVPSYLPAVPIDPFDPQQHPLRYRRVKGGKYVLYSVDENEVDDRGKPTAYGEYRRDKVRDLMLEHAFSQ